MKYLWLFLILVCSVAVKTYAWPRQGYSVNLITNNAGDTLVPFTVNIGTTTPVLLYTQKFKHREITIQNPSASYLLYVSTFSTFTGSSNRMFVPKQGTITFNSTETLYGLYESGAGSGTIEVLGGYEYDSKD